MKTRHCALWKKLLIAALILAVLCAAVAGGLSLWVWGQARGYLLSQEEAAALSDVDAILVLGCGVRPDGTPSLMLQDRLEMGLTLYEAGAAPKLLMCGDHSRAEYDEVNAMKDYVVERGVPSEDVFLDHAGFSTYESMYRARDVFQAKKILIVSQRYHLYRAIYDARALGLDAYGVAAEDIAYTGQLFREAREILARDKDFFYCIFKPLPTFLGEAIPVSGDGNATAG